MKLTKTLICLLLAVSMVFCTGCQSGGNPQTFGETTAQTGEPIAETTAPAEGEKVTYQLGDQIQDFTVTTFDGKTITLSEVLKEKDMVFLNFWATWCGPCGSEFPFLQEAYEQYQDRVEVIALSTEADDTNEALGEYAAKKGLTFPIGRDTLGLNDAFSVTNIPTSVVVDRFGTVCFREIGSQPNTESFADLFELFLGDDYTESIIQHGIPRKKSNVAPSSEAALSAALNGEGGTLAFTNDTDAFSWPMVVGEKDGRTVAASSNHLKNHSIALVYTTVEAKAGDALAITFKVSSEAAYDLMEIWVDGELVKCFGGERDWTTYAYPFDEDGAHDVTIAYSKDNAGEAGEDMLWLDKVELLSGQAAAAALEASPTYPRADAVSLVVTNADAREIVFDKPENVLTNASFYIIPGDTAEFLLTVDSSFDPETLSVYSDYDGKEKAVLEHVTPEGYVCTSGIDSLARTGYSYTILSVYDTRNDMESIAEILFFADAENLRAFVAEYLKDANGNPTVQWKYADDPRPFADAQAETSGAEEVAYTVRYVDQNGQGVAGVTCQVCNDTTCSVYVSDENGLCQFTLAPYAYEIHTLKLPQGYTGDTKSVITAPMEGGEMTITLEKN